MCHQSSLQNKYEHKHKYIIHIFMQRSIGSKIYIAHIPYYRDRYITCTYTYTEKNRSGFGNKIDLLNDKLLQ